MSKNVKNNTKNNTGAVDSRFKSLKTFSVASIVIFISLAIVLNVFLYLVFDKAWSVDLSATKQNSASDVFIDYVNSVPANSNIRIVALFERPDSIANSPYQYIVPFLDDLDNKCGDRLNVDYVDITTNPTITGELDPLGLTNFKNNCYYVNYDGNNVEVNPYYCFTFDQNGYIIENNVEVTFANAVYKLTNPDRAKAYFLTGLNNMDEHEYMNVILTSLCIDAESLPISDNFTVPSDCDLFIISGINMDITEQAAVQLIDYINRGGKIIVAVDFFNNAMVDYENLNNVLHEVNIHMDPYLVTESNIDYMLDMYGYQSYSDISDNYSYILNGNRVRTSYVRSIRKYDNPHHYIVVDSVLTTSDNANVSVIGTNGYPEVLSPVTSTYNTAMHATFTDVTIPPEVYVFGTTDFISDAYYQTYGLNDNNAKFIKGIVSSMLNRGTGIDIPSRPIANYNIDASKATTKTTAVITFIYIVIIPLAFIIIAAIVYNKRKNL